MIYYVYKWLFRGCILRGRAQIKADTEMNFSVPNLMQQLFISLSGILWDVEDCGVIGRSAFITAPAPTHTNLIKES